jgi:hypothetical protein
MTWKDGQIYKGTKNKNKSYWIESSVTDLIDRQNSVLLYN